ncbi:MAG: cell division protein FtsL [Gammaproteobacteria bacterium]|nr:cell division protein FtsL [Gammaproteobacteria bacterium]
MNRVLVLVAALAAVNVCSAIAVIYLKHLARLRYVEISEHQAVIDELDVEWSRLQIEESTFSEHALVERIASERLDMSFPDLSETVMITR